MSIAQKMSDIIGNMKEPEKSGHLKLGDHDYHTRDDLVDVLRQELAERGIATSMDTDLVLHKQAPSTKSGAEQFRAVVDVTMTFTDSESGESIESSSLGESVMTGDKATASAITQAVRFLLTNTFQVSDGMVEGLHNKTHPQNKNVNRGGAPDSTPPFKAIKSRMKDMGFSADQYKAFMRKLADKEGVDSPGDIADARRAVWKKRICGGPEDKVRKKIMSLIGDQAA